MNIEHLKLYVTDVIQNGEMNDTVYKDCCFELEEEWRHGSWPNMHSGNTVGSFTPRQK